MASTICSGCNCSKSIPCFESPNPNPNPSNIPLSEEIPYQRHLTLTQTFNFWTLGVLMPIIAIFGILANTASIVVLTRRSMRSSPINIYLAGLSVFDCLLLVMTFFLYPAMSYCELEDTQNSPWCQYFFHSALVTYPLSLIMQSGSVWTLVALTVDRFINITFPLQSRDWCTSRRAYWVMIIIAVWSVLYNLPSFFELTLEVPTGPTLGSEGDYDYSTTEDPSVTSSSGQFVVMIPTDLRRDSTYIVAYKGYCYLIFMLLFPAGLMIILNVFVTLSVRKAYRLRKAMSGREEKERRCTIMAVLVVVTFLVLNSLAFVNNLIEIFSTAYPSPPPREELINSETVDHSQESIDNSQPPPPESKSTAYLLLVSVGNLLVALNSATNFLIYCALGLRFRKMFCSLFCPRKCGESLLAADIMMNDKSYHSLSVRHSVYGNEKRIRPEPKSHLIKSPVIPRYSSQMLVDDGFDSMGGPSGVQSPGSSFSMSPQVTRNCKVHRDFRSFV